MPVSYHQELRAPVILSKSIQLMNHNLSEVAFIFQIPVISILYLCFLLLHESYVQLLLNYSTAHFIFTCVIKFKFKWLTNKNIPEISFYVCKEELFTILSPPKVLSSVWTSYSYFCFFI